MKVTQTVTIIQYRQVLNSLFLLYYSIVIFKIQFEKP